MSINEKISVIAALLALPALLGCEADLSAASAAPKARPLPVEVLVLKHERRRPQTRVVAQLEPHKRALLKARIAATVVAVPIELGARVKRQSLLVQLSDQALGLRLNAARARRSSAGASAWRARRHWRRIRKLVRIGALPRAQLDRATSALRQARAGWHAQHAELAAAGSQRTLRAPFVGWVTELFVNPGDEVSVGQPLVAVADTTRLRARIGLSPREAEGVKKGDVCQFRVSREDAGKLAGQLHKGRVVAVGVAISARTRRVPVDLEIESKEGGLKAGIFAEATVYVGAEEDVLLIPEHAVVSLFDLPYAFVAEKGRAVRRRLELTGRRWGHQIEVRKGLRGGEALVVVGQQGLSAKAAVKVVEPEEKS